jgi:hypothetical protein
MPIMIRPAAPDDALALERLAQLDSGEVPSAPVLIAEAGGALRAALSLRNGDAIADPFHPSEAVLQLLRTRAFQLCGRQPVRRSAFLRLLTGWARPARA